MNSIAIIGLGDGGLPLALQFARSGVSVLGLDIDRNKTGALNAGENHIAHVSAKSIAARHTAGLLEASTGFSRVAEGSAVLEEGSGLAYKANIGDDRESPTSKLSEKFEALGASVAYHDPAIPLTREHACYAGRKSVAAITPDHNLIVLAAGHDEYKSFAFSGYPVPLIDTRNTIPPRHRPNHHQKA